MIDHERFAGLDLYEASVLALSQLKDLEGLMDIYGAHDAADSILIDFLAKLGYVEIAQAWEDLVL